MATTVHIHRGFPNMVTDDIRIACMGWSDRQWGSISVLLPGDTTVRCRRYINDPIPLLPGWRVVEVAPDQEEDPPSHFGGGGWACTIRHEPAWEQQDLAAAAHEQSLLDSAPATAIHVEYDASSLADNWRFTASTWEGGVFRLTYRLGDSSRHMVVHMHASPGSPLPLLPGWTCAQILDRPANPSPGDIVAILEGPKLTQDLGPWIPAEPAPAPQPPTTAPPTPDDSFFASRPNRLEG